MKERQSEPNTSETRANQGMENQGYVRSQSDHYLSSTKVDDDNRSIDQIKRLLRASSAAASTFPIIDEIPTDVKHASPSKSPLVGSSASPSSVPASGHTELPPPSSTVVNVCERQPSLLDPMSDRVSTILVWQNITVSALGDKINPLVKCCKSSEPSESTRKCLLHGVTGAITGGLWAVIGPSGSGKSTLLNTLACRLDVNTVVEGEMRLNGAPYDNAELKRIAGYVMQDDLLNGYLTVEETLMYTAELRLPRAFTSKQRRERVDDVMKDLGLVHVRNAVIGTQLKQGISGSERKRLCVGMQLLNRPQLLFLDEPTTGLDSVTALDLLHTLYGLAHGQLQEKAVTVVCSIHQPQAKIFNLFDSVILLKLGHIVYQGPRCQAMEVFGAAGFPCPLYTNPADHLLDVITPPKIVASNTSESALSVEQQSDVDQAILQCQPPLYIDLKMGEDKRVDQMANLPLNPTWHKQVRILFRRNLREQSRRLNLIFTSIIQTVIMAVLIGTVFPSIGQTQASIVRRQPVIFFCIINQGVFGALTVINSFPVERTLTLRERASGTYFASAYFIAKIIADTLVQLPIPILFSSIVYFLVGFQATASKFLIFTLFMLLCSIASTSLALMVSALCKTTDMSVTVLPMVLEVTRLFGGFFLAPSRLPKYFTWLDALSYIKYSFVGASLSELQGLQLTCERFQGGMINSTSNQTAKCIKQGEDLIQDCGYDQLSIVGCIAILIGFIIFCRTWAFIGVRFLKN